MERGRRRRVLLWWRSGDREDENVNKNKRRRAYSEFFNLLFLGSFLCILVEWVSFEGCADRFEEQE